MLEVKYDAFLPVLVRLAIQMPNQRGLFKIRTVPAVWLNQKQKRSGSSRIAFQYILKSSFSERLNAAVALALALCLGLFIFLVYKKCYAGVMYAVSASEASGRRVILKTWRLRRWQGDAEKNME